MLDIISYQLTSLTENYQLNFTHLITFNIKYDEVDYSLTWYCCPAYVDEWLFVFDELNPGAYMLTQPPIEYPYLPDEVINELTWPYIYEQIGIYVFKNVSETIAINLGFLQGNISTGPGVMGTNTLNPIFYKSDYEND